MKHCVASCPRRAATKKAAASVEAMEPADPEAQAALVVPAEAPEVMVAMTADFAVDA